MAAVNGSCFGSACAPNSKVTAAVSGSGTVATFTSRTAGVAGNFTLTTNGGGQTLVGGSGGSNSQASIIAYDNLYSGCGGTVPQIYWSYNTSGTVSTSPVLSLMARRSLSSIPQAAAPAWSCSDGSPARAARITPRRMRLRRTLPPPLAVVTRVARAPQAGALLSLSFANAANDTNSSPYYDYGSDVLFVADDTGHIHKFTGVFGGTPAEVGNPWVTLTSGNIVDGAIYDSVSGLVLAGDSGGFFYNVACTIRAVATPCATAGVTTAVNKSVQLAVSTNGGIVDSPIVDGTAGQVYVFRVQRHSRHSEPIARLAVSREFCQYGRPDNHQWRN